MANDRGLTGREGPPGREGEIGKTGASGVAGSKGEKGDSGYSSIPSLTTTQFQIMRISFWFAVLCFLIMVFTPIVLIMYPFKAVVFEVPIKVLNSDKRIVCPGTINLEITYEKFLNSPGLTVMTIGYEKDGLFYPLDSTTIVSDLKKGQGILAYSYSVPVNPNLAGKNRKIVFSMYHWLLGLKPIMEQYSTEFFEIYCNNSVAP